MAATDQEILAIIPARAGSKGIRGKNTREVGGKPLIVHTLEHVRATPEITRAVVSTNSEDVALLAKNHGAEVIWRPAELCTDEASSESALLHVLDFLKRSDDYEPDLVVFLQVTSPMRRPGDISAAIRTLNEQGADSLLSGCRAHGFVWTQRDGAPVPVNYDHRSRPRRQDAPVDWFENGSIYVFKPSVLRIEHSRLGGKVAVFEMSILDSFQVDEPDDLRLIEQLMTLERQES